MSEQTPLEEAAKALFGNGKSGDMTKLLGSPILWGVAGFFIGMYSCKGKIKKLEEKIGELEKRLEEKQSNPEEKYGHDLSGFGSRNPRSSRNSRKRTITILD